MRRLRHRADGLRPRGTPAQRVDEIRGRGLRPPVIAHQRRPYEIALDVQRDQAVRLRGDADRLHPFEQPASRRLAE